MKFEPGKSGNPGGRPKVTLPDGRSLTELCRAHTETAVNALVEICTSPDAPKAAVVASANALLDRGWGKPQQAVEITGKDGGAIEYRDLSNLSAETLRELAAMDLAAEETIQ